MSSLTPILRSLRWLPVHFRVIFKILLLTYKALNGLTPDYIRDLLQFNISGRTLRSSNNRLLDEPRANLKTYGERAFLWQHQGSGINYPSRSDFHHQRQFLRLILRLIFLSVHLICNFYFLFVA